jgi:hypothetical protein
MRIRTRTFKLQGSERTNSKPSAVMELLLDPSTWPGWQPEITQSRGPAPLERGDVVSGSAQMLGFVGVQGRSAAVDVGDNCFEEDVVVGIGMRVRYEVEADGEGAIVTHSLESDLPTGVAGRLLSLVLRKRLKRLQRTALERLAAHSEMQASRV